MSLSRNDTRLGTFVSLHTRFTRALLLPLLCLDRLASSFAFTILLVFSFGHIALFPALCVCLPRFHNSQIRISLRVNLWIVPNRASNRFSILLFFVFFIRWSCVFLVAVVTTTAVGTYLIILSFILFEECQNADVNAPNERWTNVSIRTFLPVLLFLFGRVNTFIAENRIRHVAI